MKIYNAEDLLKMSKNGTYELMNDIDFNGSTIKYIIDDFRGSLDGKGHVIKNIVLEKDVEYDEQIVSLINTMSGTTLKNITFENILFKVHDKLYKPKISILCGECERSIVENVLIRGAEQSIPMISLSNGSTYINCKCNGRKNKQLIGYSYLDKFVE